MGDSASIGGFTVQLGRVFEVSPKSRETEQGMTEVPLWNPSTIQCITPSVKLYLRAHAPDLPQLANQYSGGGGYRVKAHYPKDVAISATERTS